MGPWGRCRVLCALIVLLSARSSTVVQAAAAAAGGGPPTSAPPLTQHSAKPASQALVGIAAGVSPAIIGADGPELTQVEAAQRLGLSGQGTTICVIDTGVDMRSSNFGRDCPGGEHCRIAFGYNVQTQSEDPTPSDWANAGGHGTHVSGVALGGFPQKLLDEAGQPLPYQRGVAFGAKLGAIRACTDESEFPYEFTRQALQKTVEKRCDVTNLSLGGFYVTPSKQLAPAVAAVLGADIVLTAAQGNDDGAVQSGARMFNVASPGAFPNVLSVGHVNNTANPGALLQLDKAITTPSGKRTSKLYANQRADTQSSICLPDCNSLALPKEIVLIKMVVRPGTEGDAATVACDLETVTSTKHSRDRGNVLLLEVPAACKQFQNSPEIWELLETLKPGLVLISLPEEDDSHVGALYYRNKQTPVLWLRADDGHALCAAIAAEPTTPVRLKALPGAALVPVPAEYAGQPAPTSSLGPAYDLDMKPDVSAVGSLYSSLPNSTFQTWPGTSMAAPYMAGVVALWKQAVAQRLPAGAAAPPGGWIAAANVALKNTARPLPFHGSDKLMWPPLKVGAGVVQALHAVVTRVSVTPPQLLVRTDATSQRFKLALSNSGRAPVTYKLAHKPAVSVSLPHAWYGDGFDATLPTAQLLVVSKTVTVLAGRNVTIDVKIDVPEALRATDTIFGGYLLLTPTTPSIGKAAPAGALSVSRTVRAAVASGNEAPVPLSVAYQGSSRDYSSLGRPDQDLALFVPALPEVDEANAAALSSKPPLFLCDMQGAKCNYSPGALRASPAQPKGLRIASTLLRPVSDIKIQVWNADGTKLLGTSPSQGAGATAPPLRRTYLTATGWDGSFIPVGGDESQLTQLRVGHTYKLKVELWPVLAAADRLVGRAPAQSPLVLELDSLLQVEALPGAAGDGTEPRVGAKLSRKGSGNGSGSTSGGGGGGGGGGATNNKASRKGKSGHARPHGLSDGAAAGSEAAESQARLALADDEEAGFDAAQLLYSPHDGRSHGATSRNALPL